MIGELRSRNAAALALGCLLLLLALGCSTGSSSNSQPASVGGGGGVSGIGGSGGGSASIGGGGSGGGIGSGGSGSPTIVSIAFAADSIDNNVFGMSVDSNGTASETPGSPFATPALAISVAVSGTMLAASSNNSLGVGGAAHVTTYKVDGNGVPTQLMDTVVTNAGEVTFSPDGKFLYLSALGQTFGYAVDANTGAIAEVVGTPWQTGFNGARNPRVSFDGKTYCVVSRLASTNERVFCYERDTITGVISSTTEFVATAEPNPIPAFAITPDSRWAISVSSALNHIDAGELSPTGARIFTQGTGSRPTGLAISPDGTLVVTSNFGSKDISVYRFNTNSGILTLIGKPVALGAAGIKAAFSSDGKYLYVTTTNTVATFSVDSSGGTLSSLSGSPVSTGPAPSIVAAF